MFDDYHFHTNIICGKAVCPICESALSEFNTSMNLFVCPCGNSTYTPHVENNINNIKVAFYHKNTVFVIKFNTKTNTGTMIQSNINKQLIPISQIGKINLYKNPMFITMSNLILHFKKFNNIS